MKYSAIDLTVMSDNMARNSRWDIDNSNLMGSDHFPIEIRIGLELEESNIEMNPRWKFKTAD